MSLNRRSMLSALATGLLLASFGAAATPAVRAQTIAAPDGWIKAESNGASIFRPNDVPSGKLYFIMIFPEESLGEKSFAQWFSLRIDTLLAKSGTLIQRGKVEQKTPKILTCTSTFKPASGEQCIGVFKAAVPRSGHGRLLMMTSDADPALRARYKTASETIIRDFIAVASEVKESGESASSGESGDAEKDKPPAVKKASGTSPRK